MERVIYCPTESLLSEATLLSKDSNLPILIGDNEKTESIIFNRDIVQVLLIPEFYSLNYLIGPIEKGFHQVIYYINDFLPLKNNIELFINNEKIKSSYEEMHKVKYIYQCSIIGTNECQIYVDKEKVEEFNFVVC